MTCQVCGRESEPCRATGSNGDDLCPECAAADAALELLAMDGALVEAEATGAEPNTDANAVDLIAEAQD